MAKDDNQQQEQLPPDPVFQEFLKNAQTGVVATTPGLGEDFPYPVRQVKGVAKELVGIAQLDIKRGGGAMASRISYGGHLLVDEKGIVARQPYEPNKDARRELTALTDDVVRASLLTTLASRGFYGTGKPSAGALNGTFFEQKDLDAMGDLLYFANARGSTWKPILAEVVAMPSVSAASTGRTIRVTSSEDLGVYLRDEAFRQLGRNLTKNELQQAIQNIQNQQRQRAMSSQDAPSPAVAARQQIGEVAPARSAAMALGAAMSAMFGGG
jgi:hypothetical protein